MSRLAGPQAASLLVCNQFSIAPTLPEASSLSLGLELTRTTNNSSLRIEREQLLGMRYAAQGVSTQTERHIAAMRLASFTADCADRGRHRICE